MGDDTFLRAILDAPDDDRPRLVFADWLDEQGDPRGEFIRVQVELANLPRLGPRRAELAAREAGLLREHADEWREPLPPLPGVVWGPFVRGFVEEVEVASWSAYVTYAPALFAAGPVSRLKFSALTGRELARFAGSPVHGPLDRLDLTDCRVHDAGVQALARSRHLIGLRALGLAGSGVGDDGVAALAGSKRSGGLTELDLSWNELTADGVAALAGSPNLARLASLDLGHNGLGKRGAWAIAESEHLVGLRSLNLASTRVGPSGLARLAESPRLAGLAVLNLRSNRVGPVGMEALAASPYLAALEELNLHSNGLGDAGAEALAEVASLGSLAVLDLRHNQIGRAGGLALAELPHLPALKRLDLRNNRPDADAVQALVDRFGDRVLWAPDRRPVQEAGEG